MEISSQFRPVYHFAPAANWMNDPNGLVWYAGEYHLFFQHNPQDNVHGPMYWGHAVSTDLLHWQHLPIALKPDEHGVIFSGSAVVDWHDTIGFFHGRPGLVAIFTHHHHHPLTHRVQQRQSLAYSSDNGRTWQMFPGNPVLTCPDEQDFRDPKVFWHDTSQQWVMVLAVQNKVAFYGSVNLREWRFLSHFAGGSFAGVWECPDLFPLRVEGSNQYRWVLEVDINPGAIAGGSGGQYFVGTFDGTTFTPDDPNESPLWIDYGKDHYAGVSWSDIPPTDGRRLWIGWMSNWQYANHTPSVGWRGVMTIPRELTLRQTEGKLRLVQRPVREVESIRQGHHAWRSITVTHDNPWQLCGVGQCLDITLACQLSQCPEMAVRVCKAGSEETLIGYDSERQELYVDRTHSGITDFHPEFTGRRSAPYPLRNGNLSLRILVDRCSVEVFAHDGLLSMTELIFPSAHSGDLEVFVKGGTAHIHDLTVYTLR